MISSLVPPPISLPTLLRYPESSACNHQLPTDKQNTTPSLHLHSNSNFCRSQAYENGCLIPTATVLTAPRVLLLPNPHTAQASPKQTQDMCTASPHTAKPTTVEDAAPLQHSLLALGILFASVRLGEWT